MSPTIKPTYLPVYRQTTLLSVCAVLLLDRSPHPSLSRTPTHTDVPVWLKSLRLHKYQHLFAELSYKEMLTMQEDYLEQKVYILQFHCYDNVLLSCATCSPLLLVDWACLCGGQGVAE